MSSHNLEEVKKICNSFAILFKGELRFMAEMGDIARTGKSLEELYRLFVKESL